MIAIPEKQIVLNQSYSNWHEALLGAGELLTRCGLVKPAYTQSMIQRQQAVSLYIGNFVALPHGEDHEELILEEGICLLQVPDGVNFGTSREPKVATILFAAALKGAAQLMTLQEIAFFCSDIENVMALSDAKTVAEIQQILREE